MDNNIITPGATSPLATEFLSKKLSDKSKKVYRCQGYIAKGIDKTKALAGFGKNSKSVTQKILDFQKGKISYNEAEKYINDYRYTQADASELTLDILTGLAGFGMYSLTKKAVTFLSPFAGKHIADKIGKFSKPIGVGLAILTGMTTKPFLRFFDRIYLKPREKRENKTFWKDTLSGAINGAMAPVAILKGAILGIPLVMAENSLQRYLFIKRNDKKSVKDFLNKQKDNLVLKGAATTVITYKARKLHTSLSSWKKAIDKAFENIKDLKPFEKVETESEFKEIANKAKLLLNPKLMQEIFSENKSTENKMRIIEEKNIFLPKFLQTIPENALKIFGIHEIEYMGMKINLDEISTIITRFKSDCPQSRTVKEAQEFISKTYGDKYTIINDKALGVGTVAETFLAKDNNTGKEVVLKFLKKGMSLEKIEKDRTEFINLIKAQKDSDSDSEKTNFLIRKINTLYDAWAKETDLSKEMEATEILGRNAKHYHAVKPIEVKNNIYVMEKAPGIQFNQFIDQMLKENKKISQKDMFYLMRNYFQVFFEQLLSVPKKGTKVMHADPHPGNVFIDLTDRNRPFTFIDTGNVLRYTPEEAIENALNHIDYFLGNTRGIAKALLRNANLPDRMTQKQAQEIVEKGLNKKVYNGHSKLIEGNLFKEVNDIGLKIMSDNNIIPNQNNTNLLKAEITYFSNLTCLKDIQKILDKNGERITEIEAKEQLKLMFEEIKESIINSAINNKRYTLKQIRDRLKFIDENKEQFFSTVLSFVQAMK